MIYVTKPFLPPLEEYTELLKKIWENNILTNRGPFTLKLENELKKKLDTDHFLFVANGTIALQLAIKGLDLTGEIITTPFSFVATTSSIMWEGLQPVFVDIDPKTFCIDPKKIEDAITPKTSAILATHVFGNPCDVIEIEKIAKRYNLKVIYDAAHAFNVKVNGKSILSYGDISTLSFHATKVFHTGEGGGIAVNSIELYEKIKLQHSFGNIGDDHFTCGINGKNSEIHGALGLINLKYVDGLIQKRRVISETYDSYLDGKFLFPSNHYEIEKNYSYYPVVFSTEEELLLIEKDLKMNTVFPRRYFYPSLNRISYINGENCPVSEKISSSILCLPLFPDLCLDDVERISNIVLEGRKKYEN